MQDWIKIFVGIMLMVTSFAISYFTVTAFEPILMIIAFLVLTYLLYRLAIVIAKETTPILTLITIILCAIVSAIIVWMGYQVVKVIAFFALAWVLFRLMVKYLAKEIEKDLREVFEG